MNIQKSYKTVPDGEISKTIENGKEHILFTPNGKMKQIEVIDIYADKGKIFKRVSDGAVICSHITLGQSASISDFIEVDDSEQATFLTAASALKKG
jgi:H2-forming N5,N10-methylenetetrahydromethanopterin dehydrogenase-like enzyme